MLRLLSLLVLLATLSCQRKVENEIIPASALIEKLKQEAQNIVNEQDDSKTVFWNNALNSFLYKENASQAYIYYQLAKEYAKTDLAKSKLYVETALGLIEKENEFFEIKVSIYNGLANIYKAEGKTFQSNHYYNKAAALITAYPNEIVPEAKVICLVNCAQENFRSSQISKSTAQNYLVLQTLIANKGELDEDFYRNNLFRVYTQLFDIYRQTSQLDSLRLYNRKVGEIYNIQGSDNIKRFFYRQKATILVYEQKLDSAIIYTHRCKELSERTYAETNLDIHQDNLYTDYTQLIALYAAKQQFSASEKYIKAARNIEKNLAVKYNSKFDNRMAQAQYYLQKKDLNAYRNLHLESLAIKDSTQASNSAKAIEEISVFYDVEAKKRSIYRLNETVRTTNRKLEIRTLLLVITGLLLLIVSGFIGFYIYVQKQGKKFAAREKMLLQQKLLRTQMEPHFIFNTLSSLQSFIRFEEKEKSIKYLGLFSKLLRSSLEMSRNDLISLDDEIEAIRNYLILQQMRNNHNFEFNIIMHEDTLGVMIPPMLIQPFAENAVIHGVSTLQGKGEIQISIDLDSDLITVEIKDNGKSHNINSSFGHTSLSGSIARERMDLLFKETSKKGTIQITQTQENYTVTLKIPYKNISAFMCSSF